MKRSCGDDIVYTNKFVWPSHWKLMLDVDFNSLFFMVYYYKARTNLYSYYYTSSVILYRTNLLPNNFLNYLGWSVDIIIDKAGRLALIDPFNAFDYWSSLWTFNSLYFLWLLLWFLSICVDSLKWNTCFFLACSKWQNSLWKNLCS